MGRAAHDAFSPRLGGFQPKKGVSEPKLEVFSTQRGVPHLRSLKNDSFTPPKRYLYPKLRFFFLYTLKNF